jgi:hypothetical protein
MGEIYLDKALGLLSSDKQKERADGLAGLILSLLTTARGFNINSIFRSQTYPAAKQTEFKAVSADIKSMQPPLNGPANTRPGLLQDWNLVTKPATRSLKQFSVWLR